MIETIVIVSGLALLVIIFRPRGDGRLPSRVTRSFNGRPFGSERDLY